MKKNLVLLGMMAVGKTTIGKIVAKKYGLQFIDTDKNIEKKNSMTINEIFKQKGEDFFRAEEENEVLGSLAKNNCIIALGGGAFINSKIRENIFKNAVSIWLDCDIKILNERLKFDKNRPLLKNENINKTLKNLYAERKEIYKEANHRIVCDGINKLDLAKKVFELYENQ